LKEIKMDVIREAVARGQSILTEYQGKKLLRDYGIPVVKEEMVSDEKEALRVAKSIGFPTVLKFCSSQVAHKTERGLIELDLHDEEELATAFRHLKDRTQGLEGGFLVQEFVKGARELVIGMIRDPQFGPCVMFGLGGVFTEILNDTSFRIAPIKKQDAMEMIQQIKGHKILEAVRGMKAVDLEVLCQSLIGLGNLGLEHEAVKEVDINPLVVREGCPVAVDALVVLRDFPLRRERSN
jgi:acyl-CoA synthetase (NDP forming)